MPVMQSSGSMNMSIFRVSSAVVLVVGLVGCSSRGSILFSMSREAKQGIYVVVIDGKGRFKAEVGATSARVVWRDGTEGKFPARVWLKNGRHSLHVEKDGRLLWHNDLDVSEAESEFYLHVDQPPRKETTTAARTPAPHHRFGEWKRGTSLDSRREVVSDRAASERRAALTSS
jgi:hypothetical protein